jgi:hypothetical protein
VKGISLQSQTKNKIGKLNFPNILPLPPPPPSPPTRSPTQELRFTNFLANPWLGPRSPTGTERRPSFFWKIREKSDFGSLGHESTLAYRQNPSRKSKFSR